MNAINSTPFTTPLISYLPYEDVLLIMMSDIVMISPVLKPNLVKRVVVTAFSVVNKIVEVTFVLELTCDNNLPSGAVSKLNCCFHISSKQNPKSPRS